MHKYTNTRVAVMRWQRVPGVTFIILPLPSLPPSAKVQIMIIATFTIAKIEINRSRNNCIQKSALLPCICIYLAKYPYPYISFHIHIYPYLYAGNAVGGAGADSAGGACASAGDADGSSGDGGDGAGVQASRTL